MPKVANIIYKSNSKKLNNKHYSEFSRCNSIDKAAPHP